MTRFASLRHRHGLPRKRVCQTVGLVDAELPASWLRRQRSTLDGKVDITAAEERHLTVRSSRTSW